MNKDAKAFNLNTKSYTDTLTCHGRAMSSYVQTINGLTKVDARFALVPVLRFLSLWFDVNVNLDGNVGDLLPCDERVIFLLSSYSPLM